MKSELQNEHSEVLARTGQQSYEAFCEQLNITPSGSSELSIETGPGALVSGTSSATHSVQDNLLADFIKEVVSERGGHELVDSMDVSALLSTMSGLHVAETSRAPTRPTPASLTTKPAPLGEFCEGPDEPVIWEGGIPVVIQEIEDVEPVFDLDPPKRIVVDNFVEDDDESPASALDSSAQDTSHNDSDSSYVLVTPPKGSGTSSVYETEDHVIVPVRSSPSSGQSQGTDRQKLPEDDVDLESRQVGDSELCAVQDVQQMLSGAVAYPGEVSDDTESSQPRPPADVDSAEKLEASSSDTDDQPVIAVEDKAAATENGVAAFSLDQDYDYDAPRPSSEISRR